MNGEFHGSLECEGVPAEGSDLLLLDLSGNVTAATVSGASGRYRLTPPAENTTGWLVARMYRPVIGVRTASVERPQQVDFRIAAAETVTLAGEIELPDGVGATGLQLDLTP